ncbi:MAG: tripartite tricarboxylate transporter substrate binding protein [Burkholderiales bacterium]
MSKVTLAISISIATIIYSGTAAFQSIAADYPERPVRVIVAAAPGSGPDVGTRIVAAELARQLGQQFVVDNRPGASGSIGMEMIARATPDGYTIGTGSITTLAINRSFLAKLPYDPDRDIQPVSQYVVTPNILAVTLSLPVKSVQELIDHARKNPGKLLFASTGNGSNSHLSAEQFKRMTSTQITHVPYKGVPQGITDLIGGQVHLIFDSANSIGAHVRAGRVRGLAVTTAKRSSTYPELPTVAESGVPNFEVVPWSGIVAPAGVSKAIIYRLNTEINRALATSTVKEKFAVLGSVPAGGTPEAFAAFIKREVIKWAEVIKNANIKAD